MSAPLSAADSKGVGTQAHLVRVGTQGNTKGACKPKVCQLQIARLIDEQVLRLEISVEDTMSVAIVNSTKQLICEFLQWVWRHRQNRASVRENGDLPETTHSDNLWSHAFRCARHYIHVFLQVEVEEFEDEVQLRLLVNDIV